MSNYLISIDPGITGAWCLLQDRDIIQIDNFPIVEGTRFIDYQKLTSIYKGFCDEYGVKIQSIIEKPFTLASQRSNDLIWRNYERLMIAFEPSVEINPRQWKKDLDIPKEIRNDKKKSIQYQLEYLCPISTKYGDTIKWYKKTKTNKISTQLDDGKIDAYCIGLAFLTKA